MASVKDMVKEQNRGMAPLQEKGNKPAGRRGSTTTQEETQQQVPAQNENPNFTPSFTFGGGSARNNEWFLSREGELALVNDQASNPALGIVNIVGFGASAGQRVWGTIANVTVELMIGKVQCSVVEDKDNRGYLKVSTNSRKVEKNDKTNYYRDFEPNNAFKAQVLSWIYPQLKKSI